MGVGARRDHVRESEIQIPERREGWPQVTRQLFERDLAIAVDPALSDR